jgi:hypothetical protein
MERCVRQAVADNRNCPAAAKDNLLKDSEILVRNHVQADPDISFIDEETLLEFVQSPSCFVRGYVATNPATPPDMLKKLSSDESPEVRMRVAANPSSHPATLHLMTGDVDSDVKISVVNNMHAPFAALNVLAQDADPYIRLLVAKTNWVLASTLEILAKDSDVFVRRLAQTRLRAKERARATAELAEV